MDVWRGDFGSLEGLLTESDALGHSPNVVFAQTARLLNERERGRVDLRSLYRAEFDFVWRALRRLGVPLSSLDDAVQDVFLVVYRRLSEFSVDGSGRGLLMAIALRVARDYRRSQQRRGVAEPLSIHLVDKKSSPLETASQRQEAETVLLMLEKLDEEKREVFVLAELQGFTAPEIASLLNLKTNTVYSRLRLARAAFEALLSGRQELEAR